MFDSILEGPLDLSLITITEPGPGLLVATSRMTTALAVFAAITGLLCVGICAFIWRHRANWLEFVWPHIFLVPFFAVASITLAFGHARKAFDAAARTLVSSASLGPFSSTKRYTLPAQGTIKVTFRREQGSRASGKSSPSTRWYDIGIPGVPAAGFTVASDRDAARAFAKQLSATLHYPVVDEAEDDGVERIKP